LLKIIEGLLLVGDVIVSYDR